MKFSNKDCFSKCDQIQGFLRIWSHLLKKYLKENFNFCAVPQSFGIFLGKHALYLKLHETWDFTLIRFHNDISITSIFLESWRL